MRKRLWIIAGATLVVAAIAAGTGIVVARNVDDNGQPITGTALERASAAALAHTGGGSVTETEVDDEEGKYEVEVTLDDGSQVDVHLDESFKVTDDSQDKGDDGANDDGGGESGQGDD